MKTGYLITAFVLAIVFANVAVALFGSAALLFTALILIPFDLVLRDVLHDHWQGPQLWIRMVSLIVLGGLVSAITVQAAQKVALASLIAFVLAGIADCAIYGVKKWPKLARMVGSNLAGATTDSVIFPVVALGVLDWRLSATQAGIKFFGSLIWTIILLPLLIRKSTNHTTTL